MNPPLVAVAHGSADPAAARAVEDLLAATRPLLPGVELTAAYVVHTPPALADALAGRPGAVVVPLLLSAGYHLDRDVTAVAGPAGALVADTLGPDPALVDVLADRLTEAGVPAGTPAVLAAAGSSDPRAWADTTATAGRLAERWAGPVVAAYASAARPSVADAVAALRAGGAARVAVASYLLAPGHFADRIAAAGGDWTSAPLSAHPAVAGLLARRYRAVCGQRRADRVE